MRGVIYARYSCEKQTENSILGQVRDCKDFAKREQIEIVNIYKDEALSGRTATKRPSFMRMINDASQKLFDYIIVWKGDRFSRSRADAAKYKSDLAKLGVRVLSATEANLKGAQAILMDGINEAFAEYFSVELAEKVTRGMKQNAIDGRFNGGMLNYGYKMDENRNIVINEEEAAVVREMFDIYTLNAVSINYVRKALNAKGFRNRRGKPFGQSTVSEMIKCTKYIGKFTYMGIENATMFPSIIDETTFNAAQSKLAQMPIRKCDPEFRSPFFFTHHIFCGYCGDGMLSTSGTSKCGRTYYYYKCFDWKKHGHECLALRREAVEKLVFNEINHFFDNNVWKELMWPKIRDIYNESVKQSNEKRKELDEINEKIDKLLYAIENGVDIRTCTGRVKELEKRKLELEKDVGSYIPIGEDHIRNLLEIFLRDVICVEEIDRTWMKDIVKHFVDKVVVTHEDIKVYVKLGEHIAHSHIYLKFIRKTNLDPRILGRVLNIVSTQDTSTLFKTIPMDKYRELLKKK